MASSEGQKLTGHCESGQPFTGPSIYLTLGRTLLPMCRMQGLSQHGSSLTSSLILPCMQFPFYSNWMSLCCPQCPTRPATLPLLMLCIALLHNGIFPPPSALLFLLLSQFGGPLVWHFFKLQLSSKLLVNFSFSPSKKSKILQIIT